MEFTSPLDPMRAGVVSGAEPSMEMLTGDTISGGATSRPVVPSVEALCQYDFMKCGKCGRLCTKPEIERAIAPKTGTGRACPCGSLKYVPANPPWWAFVLPRVLAFAWRRLLSGLRGWRTARVQCQAPECAHASQAVFRVGTPLDRLTCPRCHGTHSAPVSDISFGDAPPESAS